MPSEFRIRRRVEFSETDMAGIMHYSNFFRFMETAEHAFFRSLGYSIVTTQFDPPVGWPRVHAWCDFKSPLRFEEEVEVRLLVAGKRSKTLSYQFRFHRVDANGNVGAEAARGGFTVVCVRRQPDGSMKAVHIPEELASKIETASPELLETQSHNPPQN